jgi:hypothetical protein
MQECKREKLNKMCLVKDKLLFTLEGGNYESKSLQGKLMLLYCIFKLERDFLGKASLFGIKHQKE